MNDTVVSAPEVEQSTEIAEYSATERGLAELRARMADRVYDVTSTKGLDEARKDRAELRSLRVSLDKLRKQLNEDDQKRIAVRNGKAKEITAAIVELEEPIDKQIKAEEERKEQARIERERAAAEALRRINEEISNIERMPLDHLNATADELRAGIAALSADELQDFDEVHLPTAQAAKDSALTKLREMLAAREAAEAQAEQLAAQRAELDRLQAEAAERERAVQEQRDAEDAARRARELAAEHVADLRGIPASLVGRSAAILSSAIFEVESINVADPRFGDLTEQAFNAKEATLRRLSEMLDAAREQERVTAEQAERQRQLDEQQAEQKRQEQERLEQQQREEEERQEAQREHDARVQQEERDRQHQQRVEREEREAADRREARRRDAMLYLVTMPDGSVWSVPLMEVVRSRAEHYAHEFDGDVERSITEDTLPAIEADPYVAKDWASGNMNWSDVVGKAKIHAPAKPLAEDDFQEGWVNGDYSVSIPGGVA